MPDFTVGNPELQELLEWVDQPAPQHGRDTHAIRFGLRDGNEGYARPGYAGLMFYHPGNPKDFDFQLMPGLSGVGSQATGSFSAETPFWARVEVRFRLPEPPEPTAFFARLQFLIGAFPDPSQVVRTVEMGELRLENAGDRIFMAAVPPEAPDMWTLGLLNKTTVIYR